MKKMFFSLSIAIIGVALICSVSMATNKQIVAGAGPSTKVVELFFSKICLLPCAVDYEFVVPPMSSKHAGGVRNTDKYLFGRTGRPLNEAEIALNKKDVFLAKVPIVFATGEGSSLSALSLKDLEKIYRGEINSWNELGGPDVEIVTVGREQNEALFLELKKEFPFFKDSKFDVILNKDDDVINFLKTPVGQYAIAFGAKPNLTEVRNIEIKEGFHAGVRLGLVYDQANENDPIVQAVSTYAASTEWHELVAQENLISVSE